MKKVWILMLTLAMVLSCTSALAAGKLRVEQENFFAVDDYRLYGVAFACVKNVGDRPVKVQAGILEVFDTEGETLTSTDYLNSYARYLQPDEYTYVKLSAEVENATVDDVDDYLLTVTGKSDNDYTSLRLPVETAYEPDVQTSYYTYDYMYATVTNNTDEPIYDVNVVLVLLTEDNNILYLTSEGMYSDKAIMPGSSIRIRATVDSEYIDAYEKQGFVGAKVDAIAYTDIDN